MKNTILFILLSLFVCTNLFAQDNTSSQPEEKDKPVSSVFENGMLIDAQTTNIPSAKTLEFAIMHKFGAMENGSRDLFGIYAPGANIRLGLNYVPVKNLQIGAGVTKNNMYTDLSAKWTFLQQTQKNAMPVSVAVYGTMAIDGRSTSSFGVGKVSHPEKGTTQYDIALSDRFSYFSQLIVSRKFCNEFSLQAGASFTHYNMVDGNFDHDIVGAHLSGRLKFSPQSSFIFNYDIPLKIKDISEQTNWDSHAKPNLSLGVEISTFTHAFQIYVGNASGILPQHNMMYNMNDPFEGIAVGFTITRLWMF